MTGRGSRVAVLAALLSVAIPAAGAAPAAAAAGITAAQAGAAARAGVAQQSDVPRAFSPLRQSAADGQRSMADFRADEAFFYKCLGYTEPSYTARAFGTKFSAAGGQAQILTTADVAPSDQLAKDVMAVRHGDRGADCYRQRLAAALRRIKVVAEVVVKQVAFAVPGTDETYAYRTTITAHGPKGNSTDEALLVGSRVGPVLTTVSFSLGRGYAVDGKSIQATAAKPVARVRKVLGLH